MSVTPISCGLRKVDRRLRLQEVPADRPGDGGDDQVDHSSFFGSLDPTAGEDSERGANERHPFRPEIPEHRDQRPEVERDIEGEAGILPAEKPRRQREMRGAADGQEFGESLDDAECDRL